MGSWNLLGGLVPPASNHAEEKEHRYFRDSGTEEEFEILEQEEIKGCRHSGDSGNESQEEADVRDSDVEPSVPITLQFQLTQSLLSQVRAGENNRNANSGKQAQLDLERMDLAVNGQAINKEYVFELYRQYNYLISNGNGDYRAFAKQVFTEIFKHAKAEVPNDYILEELITNCNQAGYDGSLLMQLSPIFFKYKLSLPHANDRKISIVYNSQGSLNIKYCPSMPVRELDTNKEICSIDAILEFTLKSQDGKVEYENGKVIFTIPEQLEDYKADIRSLLDDIKIHFEDADNSIVESLLENIGKGPKSFIADLPAEVDSDSFDIIPENTVFDLGHVPELIKKAVDDKDVNALANHIGFFQDHVTHVSSKEGLPVVEKTLEIVSGFIEEEGKAWNCYPTVPIPIASHIYSAKQQYYDGYISQEDYDKVKSLEDTLCKIKSNLIIGSSNSGSPVINSQDTSAILNETPTSSQAVSREQLNTKEFKNQQPQRNIVDKIENIMNNKKASIKEAIGNNCEEDKIPGNEKTIGEKLSNAVSSINLADVIDLLRKVDDSVYKSTLQKLLGQANDEIANLEEVEEKKNLTEIIVFFKKEIEKIAAASDQQIPVKEVKERESDSPSLSSEDNDFSKLEGDDSARVSSDSPSLEVIDDEAEVSAHEMPLATERAEAKPDNLNDEKDDQQNLTVPTVSSSVSKNIGSNSASEAGSLDDDQKQDIQSEALASEIENINNDITVNQSAERVEKIANEDTLPELEIVATSALPKATANGTVSSNSVPCTLRVELTSDDENQFLLIETEDVNNGINVNQPNGHVEQVANGNGQPKTELPGINEQSSKNKLKAAPQNTIKYVVAAAALAIAGIASGVAFAIYLAMLAVEVAVAVHLEMLVIGVAVATCCLIADTITYCCRPKSLVEDNEVEEVDVTQKSTPRCADNE